MDAAPSEKRSFAARVLRLLRMWWLPALAMLGVVALGLRAGWSAPGQWSNGFSIAGAAQVIIAAIMMMATPADALDASTLRYVANSSVSDTRFGLVLDTLRRKKFGLRVLIGGLLSFLLAAVVLWV